MLQASLADVQEETPIAEIRVGTSGFSFADWIGPVYPPGLRRERMLEYYEQELRLDTVELNYTYYSMPIPKTLEGMVRRTGPDFKFVVRSHKSMTHDIWEEDGSFPPPAEFPYTAQEKAVSDRRSGGNARQGRKRMKILDGVFGQFRAGIEPLAASGKLGCVLVQLPSFFWPGPESYNYLRKLPEWLPNVPLVVEFRNRAWVRETTYQLLRQLGIGYCVVDEPQLPRLMPFDPRCTSGIAYFRFHGRNPNWFVTSRLERYNYLYSPAELQELAEPIVALAQTSVASVSDSRKVTEVKLKRTSTAQSEAGVVPKRVFVFFNNCHAGAAARNALMMKEILGLIQQMSPTQRMVVEGKGASSQTGFEVGGQITGG